jgi:protein SCO1
MEGVAVNIPKRTNFCFISLVVMASALLLIVGIAQAHTFAEHANQSVSAGQAGTYKRSMRSYSIPDVTLTDFDERPIRLREFLSSSDPVMLNFIFTTCSTICPVTTQVLSEVSDKIGRSGGRLRMISISIDPENDTPLQLKAYARSFKAGERWKFLTGRTEDVKTVLRALESDRGDKMNHLPVTLMRQGAGQSWIRIDGFATPDELLREYRKVVQ